MTKITATIDEGLQAHRLTDPQFLKFQTPKRMADLSKAYGVDLDNWDFDTVLEAILRRRLAQQGIGL